MLECLEDRCVPAGVGAGQSIFVTAADAGGGPDVKVFDAANKQQLLGFFAFDSHFTGGVRAAVGDVNGDGVPDIVTAAGPGGGPDVAVFNGKDGTRLFHFYAYDQNFTGGVYVAVGDVNGDGFADIICGADAGGGPNITIFSGKDNGQTRLASFFAYDPNFTGGVRVSAADVNGDGKTDILCGAGPGGGPNVTVFSGADNGKTLLASFFAFDPKFTAGIYVAAGDVNGDHVPDVVTGAGPGGGPNVSVFDLSGHPALGAMPPQLNSFFPYDMGFTGGVRVAAADADGDGKADVITVAGPGGGPDVGTFNGLSGKLINHFFAYDPQFSGGLYVAGFAAPAAPDSQPPTLSANGPSAGALLTANPTISGQVSDDGSGVASLTAQMDGGTPVAVTVNANGAFTFTPQFATDGTADGNHALRLQATDRAGNPSTPTTFTFVLDTSRDAPAMDRTTMGAGFNLTSGPSLSPASMQLAATRTVSGTTIKFYNDNPNVATWSTDQINIIMSGVNDMNAWTDNNGQLLIDPSYGKILNFVMTDETRLVQFLGQPPAGSHWNGLNSDEGTARYIMFINWNTNDAYENHDEKTTVQHEIGHNFDSSDDKYQALNRRLPNAGLGIIQVLAFFHWQWIGQSGWEPASNFQLNDGGEIADRTGWDRLFKRPLSQMTLSGDGHWYYFSSVPANSFARDYSKYNPYEDWSTTIQVYSDIVSGVAGSNWRTTDAGLLNKLKLLDAFFAEMGNDAGHGNLFTDAEIKSYVNNAYTSSTGYHGLAAP